MKRIFKWVLLLFPAMGLTGCGRARVTGGGPAAADVPAGVSDPVVGECVDVNRARELCVKHDIPSVIAIIDEEGPATFKAWTFDGVSVLCEPLARLMTGSPNVTTLALRHDLRYAYGKRPDANGARKEADRIFLEEMEADGADWLRRHLAYWAVRGFGAGRVIRTSYTWGFARK